MSRKGRHLFTSESVTEGHPDKIADQISDSILDAILAQCQRYVLRVRHRHDAGCIHRAHTLDQTENALELVLHVDGFGGSDFDPCQVSSALNVVDRKSHDQSKTVQKQGRIGYHNRLS